MENGVRIPYRVMNDFKHEGERWQTIMVGKCLFERKTVGGGQWQITTKLKSARKSH